MKRIMKAKRVRQTIKATVKNSNGSKIEDIMRAIWRNYPATSRRRIDRSIKKLIKWGDVRFDRAQGLFFEGNKS